MKISPKSSKRIWNCVITKKLKFKVSCQSLAQEPDLFDFSIREFHQFIRFSFERFLILIHSLWLKTCSSFTIFFCYQFCAVLWCGYLIQQAGKQRHNIPQKNSLDNTCLLAADTFLPKKIFVQWFLFIFENIG